jgi:dTDP-4-amino-4,6-dideoxygalactose transaminase
MKIPFFNYPEIYRSRSAEFDSIFKDVCSRGAFILQKDVQEFENKLKLFTGRNYAIALANGTDAIWLALLAAGISSGDEVIISTHTFIATAGAVRLIGAVPVPVDIDDDGMISPIAVEKAITKKTRLILPTQVNGRMCKMNELLRISENFGIPIIEDGAQGLGAKFQNQTIGFNTLGASISFYPAKSLGSFGDAGAFVTDDKEIHRKVLLMRDHGRNSKGEYEMWGFNSRLDNLQCAILNYKMTYFESELSRRREIAEIYHQNLKDIPFVKLPPPPSTESDNFDVFQNYEIQAEMRDDLKKYLSDNGVGTLIQWGGVPIHSIKSLDMKFVDECQNATKFFEKCIMLPMNTTLTDNEIVFISGLINNFYNR